MRHELSEFEKEYLDKRSRSEIVVDGLTALMTKKDFDELLDYSHTLPSGAYIGKRWKRLEKSGEWLMGEFAPNPNPKVVDIIWRSIVIA